MFLVQKKNGEWAAPTPLGENINGFDHDACIALSPDGQTLFIYKDTRDKKGEIYYSTINGRDWDTPKPLLGEVNTAHWEGSASISTDGKTLFFTSDFCASTTIFSNSIAASFGFSALKNSGLRPFEVSA